MIIDLSSLSDLCQVGSVFAAAGALIWRVFLAPSIKARKKLFERVAALEKREEDADLNLAEDIKDLNEKINDSQKDLKDFKDDIKDRIKTIDDKNEKLLNLLLQYFASKD